MYWMILLLILMTGASFFAVQNSAPVTISFILWRFEASLAIVIFLSIITGAIMSAIVYMITSIKKSLRHDKQTAGTDLVNHESEKKELPDTASHEAGQKKGSDSMQHQ